MNKRYNSRGLITGKRHVINETHDKALLSVLSIFTFHPYTYDFVLVNTQ